MFLQQLNIHTKRKNEFQCLPQSIFKKKRPIHKVKMCIKDFKENFEGYYIMLGIRKDFLDDTQKAITTNEKILDFKLY